MPYWGMAITPKGADPKKAIEVGQAYAAELRATGRRIEDQDFAGRALADSISDAASRGAVGQLGELVIQSYRDGDDRVRASLGRALGEGSRIREALQTMANHVNEYLDDKQTLAQWGVDDSML